MFKPEKKKMVLSLFLLHKNAHNVTAKVKMGSKWAGSSIRIFYQDSKDYFGAEIISSSLKQKPLACDWIWQLQVNSIFRFVYDNKDMI